jgi:hypothetical protein
VNGTASIINGFVASGQSGTLISSLTYDSSGIIGPSKLFN